jgi:DNA-binding response OmpR family regulator
MVATCDREETVIRAFAAGADDIVAKPPRLAELVARLQALMRRVSRQATEAEQVLERGPFRLDQSRLEVSVASRRDPVRLTPLEAKLLGLLMVNANQVMSKARLQELIWGYQNDSSGDLLKTHVRHLRVKLEAMPSFPQYIQTINGVGYTFTAPKGPEMDEPPDLVLGVASAARQEDLQAI